eukprot:CAMPEP_0115063364 /NCGR_PEP_ID=MMETSP0227-20121206/9068_1 /TAXON_ID=89957 /ORGANISM="Polarella glacialis, Strain CCMP 1383" /LENGTH=87 /DNA_ID=CAMNT_0002448861 /DNA_START=373 /DNA_END=636 /DNA_ORIENTATION=+
MAAAVGAQSTLEFFAENSLVDLFQARRSKRGIALVRQVQEWHLVGPADKGLGHQAQHRQPDVTRTIVMDEDGVVSHTLSTQGPQNMR